MIAQSIPAVNAATDLLTKKQPIISTAVYDRDEAVAVTGFSLSTLIRAEERGDLIGRHEGRRRFYLGKDLLDWLAGDDQKEGTEQCAK